MDMEMPAPADFQHLPGSVAQVGDGIVEPPMSSCCTGSTETNDGWGGSSPPEPNINSKRRQAMTPATESRLRELAATIVDLERRVKRWRETDTSNMPHRKVRQLRGDITVAQASIYEAQDEVEGIKLGSIKVPDPAAAAYQPQPASA